MTKPRQIQSEDLFLQLEKIFPLSISDSSCMPFHTFQKSLIHHCPEECRKKRFGKKFSSNRYYQILYDKPSVQIFLALLVLSIKIMSDTLKFAFVENPFHPKKVPFF